MNQCGLEFAEEIYTSAAELLDGGSSNLGVVSRTRDFPRAVSRWSSSSRCYSLLTEIPLEQVELHPPRFLFGHAGPDRRFFVMARVVFAGADHTGRTTPLAHTLVLDREADAAGVPVWSLIEASIPLFLSSWSGPPKWIEPARRMMPAGKLEELAVFDSAREILPHGKLAACGQLASVGEALIRTQGTGRQAVVIIPREWAARVPNFVAGILATLPASMQCDVLAASHVVTAADAPRDSSLLLTYPETPYAAECRRRTDALAPHVFDWSPAAAATADPATPYAKAVAALCRRGGTAALGFVTRSWDRFGMLPPDLDNYVRVINWTNDLGRVRQADDLEPHAARLAKLSPTGGVMDFVCHQTPLVLGRLAGNHRQAYGSVLVRLRFDGRWPTPIQDWALQQIVNDSEAIIGSYLQAAINYDAELVYRDLAHMVGQRPDLLEKITAHAGQSPEEEAATWLDRLLKQAAPDPRIAIACATTANRMASRLESRVWQTTLDYLARSCTSAPQLRQAAEVEAVDADLHPTFRHRFILPIVRRRLRDAQGIEQQLELLELFADVGWDTESFEGVVTQTLDELGDRVPDGLLETWAQRREKTPVGDALRGVAQTRIRSTAGPPIVSGRVNAGRRTGSSSVALGPIASTRYVSILLAAGLLSWAVLAYLFPNALPVAPGKVSAWIAVVPLILWLFVEGTARWLLNDPRKFWIARAARWATFAFAVTATFAVLGLELSANVRRNRSNGTNAATREPGAAADTQERLPAAKLTPPEGRGRD